MSNEGEEIDGGTPTLHVQFNVGPRLDLSTLGGHLADLDRALAFAGDLAVLGAVGHREFSPGWHSFAAQLGPANLLDQSDWKRLGGRVARGPRADALADWWLTLPMRSPSGARVAVPPAPAVMTYRNPLTVVLASVVVVSIQAGAWLLHRIQTARLAQADIRLRQGQRVGTGLDNLKKIRELNGATVLTEELIREVVPGIGPEAVRALAASSPGVATTKAISELPEIVRSSLSQSESALPQD